MLLPRAKRIDFVAACDLREYVEVYRSKSTKWCAHHRIKGRRGSHPSVARFATKDGAMEFAELLATTNNLPIWENFT